MLVANSDWDYWMGDYLTSTNDFESGFKAAPTNPLQLAIKYKVRFSPTRTKLFVALTTLGGQVPSERGVEWSLSSRRYKR